MAVDSDTLRQRKPIPDDPIKLGRVVDHPGGDVKHGGPTELLRLVLIVLYFVSSCCAIVVTQFLGVPLYWYNKDLYYAYMALTKQSFGIFVTTLTQWWSPTVVRISGDASVSGQIRKSEDGRVELHFPDRLVMMANHQLYSDWLYLWWAAYTNKPSTHGHIFIILKESLKYMPVIGWGMMFYGFIFMSRKMATDEARLAHRLNKLKAEHTGPLSGTKGFDPMWLLIFPEGTNASPNTKPKSDIWAKKIGAKVLEILIEYSRGEYGQDHYTLRSTYLRGQPPPSVNMYWRRIAIADIPLSSAEEFDIWLRERWYEKDAFMEQYIQTGRFPANEVSTTAGKGELQDEYIETSVKLAHWYEVGNIFVVLASLALVLNLISRVFRG